MTTRHPSIVASVAWIVLMSACGSADAPAGPTPATLAPGETFALPFNAPADATAPPGTTRITITTLEILRTDGTRAQPTRLTPLTQYTYRVWIYCPRGLEGPVDEMIVRGHGTLRGLALAAGYNALDDRGASFAQPGTYSLAIDVVRSFSTIASSQTTLVASYLP